LIDPFSSVQAYKLHAEYVKIENIHRIVADQPLLLLVRMAKASSIDHYPATGDGLFP
jgi:hypothetical protein